MQNYKRNKECKKPTDCNPFAQFAGKRRGGCKDVGGVVLANPKVTTKMQVSAPN